MKKMKEILKACRWGFFSGGATALFILMLTEPKYGWSHNWILLGWCVFCCIGFGLSYLLNWRINDI
jgi:hypothetical protein